MKKKIMALVLATTMVLGMSISVSAADAVVSTADASGAYTSDLNVTGTTKVPTIKVTIPSTGDVLVNPYKMEYTLSETKYYDQIVSANQYIKNESDVPIAVNATITGTAEGNAVFATTPAVEKLTTNSVFMYFEIKEATDGSTPGTYAASYSATAVDQIAVGTKAVTKKKMITLAAGASGATFASFKLNGSVATAPTKAWTAADKVSVAIVFSFEPQVVPSAGAGA